MKFNTMPSYFLLASGACVAFAGVLSFCKFASVEGGESCTAGFEEQPMSREAAKLRHKMQLINLFFIVNPLSVFNRKLILSRWAMVVNDMKLRFEYLILCIMINKVSFELSFLYNNAVRKMKT